MQTVLGLDLSKRRGAIVGYSDGLYFDHTKFAIDVLEDAYLGTVEFLNKHSGLFTGSEQSAYIESPVVGRGGALVTIQQSFVSGVVQLCLQRHGWSVDLVNVQSWKKHVVGSGNSNKQQVSEWFALNHERESRLFGGDQDLTDAACVGLYGLLVSGEARAVDESSSL